MSKTKPVLITLPGTFDEFKEELNVLCERYNFWQYFICVSEANNQKDSEFTSAWSKLSEGQIGAIEQALDYMKTKFDE